MARPASAKPDQVNAPIEKIVATPEVTIVDPRHPLYDQTFPLLHVKNHRNLIPSCLIRVLEGVDRLVPVAVTDLAATPVIVYSSPLDVSSLENLVQAFARVEEQVEVECGDENREDPKPNAAGDQSQAGVANTGSSTAGDGLPDRRSRLSQPDPGQESGGTR